MRADGKTVKTITGDAFSTFMLSNEAFNPYELKYSLNLSRKTLGLDGSTYTLRIFSADEALTQLAPLEIPVQYLDKLKYKPAVAAAAAGKQFVISYYPDSSGKYSVPVSREIPKSSKLFRTAVNQLLTPPPASMGLKGELLVPRVSTIQYTSGLISCRLGDPVAPALYTDPVLANAAYRTLTDSISAIESPYRISKIRYSWNGVPPVPGWPLEEIVLSSAPKVWLALSIKNSHVLLVPAETDSADPAALFNLLKKGMDELIPTVPGQAKLLRTRIEGDTLILTFDTGFQGLFDGAPDQAALLIDSLTHTYLALPDVKYLRLEEGSSPIQTLGGITLAEPIQAAPYMNPEKAFIQ